MFFERFSNISPAWCCQQCEGLLIWPYYIFPTIRHTGFTIITTYFSLFSVAFIYQRLSSCSCTVDVGFVKLSSDCFCGNSVFKMNVEFYRHICCSSFMIFRHSPLQCRRFISLSFGFRPLFLSADYVFPWFVYAVITLGPAALNKPN